MTERGQTRSGLRYSARNEAFYSSEKELMSHHQRLLAPLPAETTTIFKVQTSRTKTGVSKNEIRLLQTTVRFRTDYANITAYLRKVFAKLFAEFAGHKDDGFEVSIVFNAILSDYNKKSFSLFYGHDYSEGNFSGAASKLKYGESYTVQNLDDVSSIPTRFDFEHLAHSQRLNFESSSVRIHKFVNIVYLIYQFLDPITSPKRSKK